MAYDDLEDLYEAMREDPAFNVFRRGQNPLIPGEGVNPTKIMVIGEAPGADEVMALRPFVGQTGQVLRQLMDIACLWSTDSTCDPSKPANCWLTNVVKYRPARNRTPTMEEITHSRPYLIDEWRLIGKPGVIVTVGAVALTAINGKWSRIGVAAGKPFKTEHGVRVWPMFHPSYGVRNERAQSAIEQHWVKLGGWLARSAYFK